MKKITAKGIWETLKNAATGFKNDSVFKLSASLAYYTIFSLGPMLIVIIFLADLFWRKEAVEGTIVGQIKGLVGNQAALQIQQIIKNASVSTNNTWTAVAGFVTLVIGATTVFSEIQDSINKIWKLKVKTGRGWVKMLITRLLSFSIVVSLGFLLLVSLIINGLLESLMERLQQMFPEMAVIIIYLLNLLVTLIVVSFLFAVIFKVLPDAIIRWKDVAVGAISTAVLFMITKFGITFYIGRSDVGSTYGAAGSLIVLLLWVYFSSIILYFGAEFTKAYAVRYGHEIRPNEYTVTVQQIQVERGKKTIQENEKETGSTEMELEEAKDKRNEG